MPRQVYFEIQRTEEDLHVVVLDLIGLVLGTSFAFVALILDIGQLLMAFLHVPWGIPSRKMAVHKDKA